MEFSPYKTPECADPANARGLDHFEEAGLGLRFYNYLIDRLMLYGLGYVVLFTSPTISHELALRLLHTPRMLITIGLGLVYYIVLEGFMGRSIGKFITGTKVVQADGKTPGMGQIIGRTLCRFIPLEPISFLVARRGWHDSLSNTVVVKIDQALILSRQKTGEQPMIPGHIFHPYPEDDHETLK